MHAFEKGNKGKQTSPTSPTSPFIASSAARAAAEPASNSRLRISEQAQFAEPQLRPYAGVLLSRLVLHHGEATCCGSRTEATHVLHGMRW